MTIADVPDVVKRAAELNYDDRAAYWEQKARDERADADRCKAAGEPRAAVIFDRYASASQERARSERKHWIDLILGRAAAALDEDSRPQLASDIRAVLSYLDGTW